MAYAAVVSLSNTLWRLSGDPLPFTPDYSEILENFRVNSMNRFFRDMANAATVSVLKSLYQLLEKPSYTKSLISNLHRGVDSLRCFLEDNKEVKRDFEAQIRDAIYEAQDIIDSHISTEFLSPSEAEISQISFCEALERVTPKINSLAEMTTEKFNHQTLDRKISVSERWHADVFRKYPLIGRGKDLGQLKERLMMGFEGLQVVPIVGIAGMGKTALARELYEDPPIREHFGIRAWVKVPIEYHKRDVLLGLLESMKKLDDGIRQKTDGQLAKHLHNALKRDRYLVVLDDVRNFVVWDDLKELFPVYNDGNRVLLTTRNADVAPAPCHLLDRLSDEDTLTLLREILFHGQPCPIPRLAAITKDIAESCRGFPQAVVIVGKLLLCVEPIAEYWLIVLSSINVCENYVDLLEALVSLTYKHLPQQQKACLLYMAIFPFEYDVPVRKLLNLLTAEGFIKRRNLEHIEIGIALDSLMLLNMRGIVSFYLKTGGIPKTCRIGEEVFHDFILRKAKEEKFFVVVNRNTNYGFLRENNASTHNQQRRLCIHRNIAYVIKNLHEYDYSNSCISNVRSLLYMGPEHEFPLLEWLDFKMLRVLDVLKLCFYAFPLQILKSIHLTYLALSYNGEIPAAVCKLQNLQVLIVLHYLNVQSGAPSYLPVEIWNMKQLIHLQVNGRDLPEPPSDTDLELGSLTTLSDVGADSCTPRVFERLSHLITLGVRIESLLEAESLSFFGHVHILDSLYSFKCSVMYPDIGSPELVPSSIPSFPSKLVHLNLSGCGFPWEYMRVIAELPNLQVLKLKSYAFHGPKWEVYKHEFPRLSFLLLKDMGFQNWIFADGPCFPILKFLIIRHCYKLGEIPLVFADSSTLEVLEVVDCSTSAMNSALQIQSNKLNKGKDFVQFDFYSSSQDD